ncbi:hypothetical protein [Bacillus sp. SJS]|uniref:hypothetical protein n=1 Tax=Bacillus sp. SJS TaxID=1423321 RepID=UPI0004DD26B3|nr:hypothetical protein [Bacillus sp. SJS]KZZ84339.1 hypothetical protein AS29_010780 [Bacillus sp. SJS]
MSHISNIQELYEQLQHELLNLKKEVTLFREKNIQQLSVAETEKVERAKFSIEAAEDLLENFISPGKTLTINYEHASITIKVNTK